MEIILEQIYKRYTREWIVKDFSYHFMPGSCIGINGINGSGKSTLIRMICGQLSPSKGNIHYRVNGVDCPRDLVYRNLSLVGPYTDIIQEYTIEEMFDFHSMFKKMDISFSDFIEDLDFGKHLSKKIGEYSSGMRQKVQLGLALHSYSDLILLDEPTSYLDDINKEWFAARLKHIVNEKTIIIASNDEFDFQYCTDVIVI